MRRIHDVLAISIAALAILYGCSSRALPPTDSRAVMAKANFNPSKCRTEGGIRYCSGENDVYNNNAAGNNDVQMLRGIDVSQNRDLTP